VKQRHRFPSKRVLSPGRWPFEFITPTAGKTEVVQVGLSTLCFGDDVVDHHWLAAIGLCCPAVCATVVVCFDELGAQCGRQVWAH
jgi:hypothetical protein